MKTTEIETLYKYVPADRVLNCLPKIGAGTLRATPPSALNDPFECAVRFAFVEPDERRSNEQWARVLTTINCTTPIGPTDVADARKEYGTLFARELVVQQISRRLGIVSFSEDHLNPLLWSHYTIDGSGFVIGYDKHQLEALTKAPHGLNPIVYSDRLVIIREYGIPGHTDSNLDLLLSMKSAHWDYEKEWRLIVELQDTIGTGNNDRRGQPINLVSIPNEAVVNVFYTERTSVETVDEVSCRLSDPNNRYGAGLPTKLILSTDTYAYEVAQD